MKCPNCGAEMKRVLQEVGDEHHSPVTGAIEQEVEIVWWCSQCGHTEPDDEIPF